MLEHCVREDLNARAPRLMGVLDPVKLVIENYPADKTETFEAEDLPGSGHTHPVHFSRELYIEREDFMEVAPNKKYFRLYVGGEVRLKNAYIIKCERVEKDADGNVETIVCTYDPLSRTGDVNANRKIKGTLHWADARTAVPAEYRVYGPALGRQQGRRLHRTAGSTDSLPDDARLYRAGDPETPAAATSSSCCGRGISARTATDFSAEHVVLNKIDRPAG